ncbi:MAG: hypothetical protein C4562_05390 [Actinobacteria bacterium]|nr:MAG: hypothetical protein C4562_05390 [Actinomycetota bacterium]
MNDLLNELAEKIIHGCGKKKKLEDLTDKELDASIYFLEVFMNKIKDFDVELYKCGQKITYSIDFASHKVPPEVAEMTEEEICKELERLRPITG